MPYAYRHIVAESMTTMQLLLVVQLTFCQLLLAQVDVDKLASNTAKLAKQLMRLDFHVEEQTRVNGHSGLKSMRRRGSGSRPYHGTHHADDWTLAAIHDHPDVISTIGMGEVQVVLNGIEFRTRHNDYLLAMKSNTSSDYGASEYINLPDVPPSVLNEATISGQINEMGKFFEAWTKQDPSIRDYKPYFKANLCYLEGAWHPAKPEEKPFDFKNFRHKLDAYSWDDLYQKTKFTSYTGIKDNEENYAYLPTKLWAYDPETQEATFGQWNYTMLCHPLNDDLPLNRLRAVDDLATRMSAGQSFDEYVETMHARFTLNQQDSDTFCDGPSRFGLLDKLMEEIPGKNNYGADLKDTAFGSTIYRFDENPPVKALNTAYYHRAFQNDRDGALGESTRFRGFNDENMWVALTTQPNVLPITLEECDDSGNNCESYTQGWSYAIPMEIIYTTPLHKWNPYDIEYKGDANSPLGKTVTQGPGNSTRDGTNDTNNAFDGINSDIFYKVPAEFFTGGEMGYDPTSTPLNIDFVLDKQKNIRDVRASGIRTILPEIENIGKLRTRYPIYPVHGEGSAVWQELSALADIIMEPAKYKKMIRNPSNTSKCN